MNQKEAERELMKMPKKYLEAIDVMCKSICIGFKYTDKRCSERLLKVDFWCRLCKKLTLKLKGGK